MPSDYVDFIEGGKWKCNECGACCAFADWALPPEDINNFGICRHLNNKKLCSIYEERPHECVVQSDLVTPEFQAKMCSWLRKTFSYKLEEGG